MSQIGRLCGFIANTSNRIGTMVPRVKNERLIMLRKKIILVVLLSLIAGTVMAQEAKVTSLMSKDLKDFPVRKV